MTRLVTCPNCGQPAIYAPENSFRPFCSERCKLIDMGAWASEAYCIPGSPDDSATSDAAQPGDAGPAD